MKHIKEAGIIFTAVLFGLTGCKKTTTSSGSGSTEPGYEALASALFASVQTIAPTSSSNNGVVRPKVSGSGGNSASCLGGGTVAGQAAFNASTTSNPYTLTATVGETFASCKAGGYIFTGSLDEAFNLSATLTPDPDGLPPTKPNYTMSSFAVTGDITTSGSVTTSPAIGSSATCSISNFDVHFAGVGFNLVSGQETGILTLTGTVCGSAVPANTSFSL
jgi:hypothetical protein